MDAASARRAPRFAALFSEDFDCLARDPEQEPEVIAPAFTAAELDTARSDAWTEGHDAGLAEASVRHEAALGDVAQSLASQLVAIRADTLRHAEHQAMMVAQLLLDTLAALFPALCARHGTDEARALCRAVIPGIRQEPAITLSVHPAWAPLLVRQLEELDPDLGARTTVVAIDSMIPGDLRITWLNGSAARDAAGLWRRVSGELAEAGVLSPEPSGKELQDAA